VDLSLDTRQSDGRTIVSVGGEIDVYTAPKLRDVISELVAEGNYHLTIDLEKVDFLDSTGLGVLVGAYRRARQRGRSLVLTGVRQREARVLRRTRLDRLIRVEHLPLAG